MDPPPSALVDDTENQASSLEIDPPLVLPPPESFDYDQPLLSAAEGPHTTCQNIQPGTKPIHFLDVRSGELMSGFDIRQWEKSYPHLHFSGMVHRVCSLVRVKHCLNTGCCFMKKLMQDAPKCEWKPFRDWALVIISCQMNAQEQGLYDESHSRGNIVEYVYLGALNTSLEKMLADLNSFDICELINWMLTASSDRLYSYRWEPLQAHVSKQLTFEATETARQKGICQNRLWNLTVGGGEEELAILLLLMQMLEDDNLTNLGSSGHDLCTAETCCMSSVDSTRVRQLHKCSDEACSEPILFPSSKIKRPEERITWCFDDDIKGPYTDRRVRYMAISHVWSDGTGGGVGGEGLVNPCLFRYFKIIAKELGCKGIWWDTICIPVERVARQKAISRMHENFKEASYTVIHDQSLTQTPWTDDGRPCLALLLSPWFTRAWTALELRMSRGDKVLVIFQDPDDPSRHILKNLDIDVLAAHPAFQSRSHWVASSLIYQLRGQNLVLISDVLKVLRTRNTSWPRDLMIIAGLLTGHKPRMDVPDTIASITRDIILGLACIEEYLLYHGHATMVSKGGFSWCPFSLLDFPQRLSTDNQEWVHIDAQGALTGVWRYSLLSKESLGKGGRVRPHSFHKSVDWRIRTALDKWENCLLLQPINYDDDDDSEGMKALLVLPLEVGRLHTEHVLLECQYIGTVFTSLEWGPTNRILIRMGKLTQDPSMTSKEAIIKLAGINDPKGEDIDMGMSLILVEHLKSRPQREEQSS